MQRIIVDLPEPEGPQTTMRSPRPTVEIDVAEHMKLAVPLVDADHLDGRFGPGIHASREEFEPSWSLPWLSPVLASCEAPLDPERVPRHAPAEDEVEQSRERVARCRLTVGAAQVGSMREASTVLMRSKMPTIATREVSLNSPMKVFTMPGITILSACGRMMRTIICQVAEAERHARPRTGPSASPAARLARPRPCRPRRTGRCRPAAGAGGRPCMSAGRKSGSIVFAMISTVMQRNAAHELDEDHRGHAHDRQLRAPSEREEDAERQREHDADGGDEERHEDAAPKRGRNLLEADQVRPREEQEREEREDDEEVEGAEVPPRSTKPEQPHDADREEDEEDVDPPALRCRIGAVGEVVQLVAHEGPARAHADARPYPHGRRPGRPRSRPRR